MPGRFAHANRAAVELRPVRPVSAGRSPVARAVAVIARFSHFTG